MCIAIRNTKFIIESSDATSSFIYCLQIKLDPDQKNGNYFLLLLASLFAQAYAHTIKTFKYKPVFLVIMAKPGKISMPSGMGGLTRYFDDYRSNIQFKPGHIIILCVIVMLIVLLLHVSGNALLG